ncbi:hypothetical protein L484_024204 [Morus notabilis]|uniref:Uncharacterized protein n=1 Tax=Morus notabilis TaxID=981085 RepID=W9RM08_9ROSA|nr:hypothetical protein L484_024204 [Morus notabilis]
MDDHYAHVQLTTKKRHIWALGATVDCVRWTRHILASTNERVTCGLVVGDFLFHVRSAAVFRVKSFFPANETSTRVHLIGELTTRCHMDSIEDAFQ